MASDELGGGVGGDAVGQARSVDRGLGVEDVDRMRGASSPSTSAV